MRENMIAFRGLPYEEYKEKAEDTDQDAKERKVGHYARQDDILTDSNSQGQTARKVQRQIEQERKTEKSSKKPQLSREEMIKQGICFTVEKRDISPRNIPARRRMHLHPNQIRFELKQRHLIMI